MPGFENYMSGLKFLSCIAFAVLLTGCSSKPAGMTLSDEPIIAKQQIQNLIPLGTTATNAELMMKQNGFRCSVRSGDFIDESNVVNKGGFFIYCNKSQSAGWPVLLRYQVALVLTDDKVTKIYLSTGLVGP